VQQRARAAARGAGGGGGGAAGGADALVMRDVFKTFLCMQTVNVGDKSTSSKKFEIYKHYVYFLLIPIVTLVLLQTTTWHENNSECYPDNRRPVFVQSTANHSDVEDDVMPVGMVVFQPIKCVCMEDFPRYMYMIVGFDVLAFVYFIFSDPITNNFSSTLYAFFVEGQCSARVVGILIFDACYITLIVLALSVMAQSDIMCGFPLWTFGLILLLIRGSVILAFNSIYNPRNKQTQVVSEYKRAPEDPVRL